MEDAERVQVLHSVRDVCRERDAQRLRQRLGRPAQQHLLQRAALHVVSQRVQLTLVHAHAHETKYNRQIKIRYTAAYPFEDKGVQVVTLVALLPSA